MSCPEPTDNPRPESRSSSRRESEGFDKAPSDEIHLCDQGFSRNLRAFDQVIGPNCSYSIQPMDESDLDSVIQMGIQVPELAFGIWENKILLQRAICTNPSTMLIARSDEQVIGFLIGGSFGVRGTISHIYVKDEYARFGVGGALVKGALEGMADSGVRRVPIMLTAGNDRAFDFWSKVGFKELPEERFMERDI